MHSSVLRILIIELCRHDAAPRSSFQPLFDKLYTDLVKSSLHPQQLALIYVILAMGTLHNLELPPNDESAEEYLGLAKGCLMKGDFLNNNTIAGVRTLVCSPGYSCKDVADRLCW